MNYAIQHFELQVCVCVRVCVCVQHNICIMKLLKCIANTNSSCKIRLLYIATLIT